MDPFDQEYWNDVAEQSSRVSCRNCGFSITPSPHSSTGYTHDGPQWEGIRCAGMLVGATPADRPSSHG